MRIEKMAVLALSLSMSLSACGGGGSSGGAESGGFQMSDGAQTGAGSIASSGPSANGNGGQNDFTVVATVVPADGAVLSNRARLEVEGQGIRNAELLPAAGGRPYARLNVDPDQLRAWVEFDTRTVPNGSMSFIIEAYDQPPRTAGTRAATAMQPRSWTIQNATISSPYPGEYPLSRDRTPLETLTALSTEDFAREIEDEWPRIHAMLQDYIPNNVIFELPVPRGFEGPRGTCIQNAYASPEACREYMSRILAMIP